MFYTNEFSTDLLVIFVAFTLSHLHFNFLLESFVVHHGEKESSWRVLAVNGSDSLETMNTSRGEVSDDLPSFSLSSEDRREQTRMRATRVLESTVLRHEIS